MNIKQYLRCICILLLCAALLSNISHINERNDRRKQEMHSVFGCFMFVWDCTNHSRSKFYFYLHFGKSQHVPHMKKSPHIHLRDFKFRISFCTMFALFLFVHRQNFDIFINRHKTTRRPTNTIDCVEVIATIFLIYSVVYVYSVQWNSPRTLDSFK